MTGILQAISTYDVNVTGTALPPGTPGSLSLPSIAPPQTYETAIEAPYRLIISPNKFARWAHSPTPVAGVSGRIELWHSRFAVVDTRPGSNGRPDEVNQAPVQPVNNQQPAGYRTIRAVWAGTASYPDFLANINGLPTAPVPNPYTGATLPYNPTHYTSEGVGSVPGTNDNGPPGFRTSLDNRDRDEIVHLTSNFHITEFCELEPCPAYAPLAVPVNRLMLSSLGAWIDLDARFQDPPPAGLSVLEWRHLATMGRDHYVKVVYAGWLAPFGHRANLVKVTERKFIQISLTTAQSFAPVPTVVAYNRQRMFIVVRSLRKVTPPQASLGMEEGPRSRISKSQP